METNGDERESAAAQTMRIAEIKSRLSEIARGDILWGESGALTPDQCEGFWRHVLEFETAPQTTDFERLIKAGIELPHPDSLDDVRLTAKLWEVVHGLATLQVILSETDHLSDRELYARLWREGLREEVPDFPCHPGAFSHLSLVSGGSETDIWLYLKYYADEPYRRRWFIEWPDHDMPPHEDPPYDRDRHLPRADYGASE